MPVNVLSQRSHLNDSISLCTVVLTRAQKSSGSGSIFIQSSGSGLIGFSNYSKLRVRVYRVSLLKFGFSGLSGSGFDFTKNVNFKLNHLV